VIIGLEVRHYKAYGGQNFIPIGAEHNFVAFAGENGVGKSSILEALDTFFNDRNWLLTKQERSDDAYICPLFLIPKSNVTKQKNEFENASDFFWNLEQKDKASKFFDIRTSIDEKKKDTHYLIFLGEHKEGVLKIPFGEGIEKSFRERMEWDANSSQEKIFLKELKNIYSYVYVPVEINSESFTKIETEEMQKIFNKSIKEEIKKSLYSTDIAGINNKLDTFVNQLEEKLEGKYFYDTGDEGTKKLTTRSLTEIILEIYFKKRVLMSGSTKNKKSSKKMSELSAGEKREALINLIYVFLRENEKRDSIIIIGIDEPENSLHTAICYEQFEKLKKVSQNAQVFITTHWYGFLPIIDKGIVHFLKNERKGQSNAKDEKVEIEFFHKADLYLYPYKTKNIPDDFSLKSTNDLIQSIFHSLKAKKPYNWLICEGPSDQIYLEYFLSSEINNNNLRIIPVGGIDLVKKFYKYLLLPISENSKELKKGKVYCLTDTDSNLRKNDIFPQDQNNLVIYRLAKDKNSTSLIKFEKEEKQNSIVIEESLNPIIFKKTLESLNPEQKFLIEEDKIQDKDGNTTTENLKNFGIIKKMG
jgi:predicted ATP-dependent endonuclease of OLD family